MGLQQDGHGMQQLRNFADWPTARPCSQANKRLSRGWKPLVLMARTGSGLDCILVTMYVMRNASVVGQFDSFFGVTGFALPSGDALLPPLRLGHQLAHRGGIDIENARAKRFHGSLFLDEVFVGLDRLHALDLRHQINPDGQRLGSFAAR